MVNKPNIPRPKTKDGQRRKIKESHNRSFHSQEKRFASNTAAKNKNDSSGVKTAGITSERFTEVSEAGLQPVNLKVEINDVNSVENQDISLIGEQETRK